MSLEDVCVGDEVVVCLESASYREGYGAERWKKDHLKLHTVLDVKKTQLTVCGGYRFTKKGTGLNNTYTVRSQQQHNRAVTIMRSNDLTTDEEFAEHKATLSKIKDAYNLVLFSTRKIKNVEDAAQVADLILAASALQLKLESK